DGSFGGRAVPMPVIYGKEAQSIAFGPAPRVGLGGSGRLSAVATSGLPVSLSSLTPSVCTIAGSTVRGVAPGTCTVAAKQDGDGLFDPALPATQTLTVVSLVTNYYSTILRRAPDPGGQAFWESEAVRVGGLGASVNETW